MRRRKRKRKSGKVFLLEEGKRGGKSGRRKGMKRLMGVIGWYTSKNTIEFLFFFFCSSSCSLFGEFGEERKRWNLNCHIKIFHLDCSTYFSWANSWTFGFVFFFCTYSFFSPLKPEDMMIMMLVKRVLWVFYLEKCCLGYVLFCLFFCCLCASWTWSWTDWKSELVFV